MGARKYIIMTADEYATITPDWNDVLEDDNTMTWNEDETMCFLKYEGTKPSFLSDFSVVYQVDMLEELKKDEWLPINQEDV